MKAIFIGLFVFFLAFTPAFVMNTVIMPQMKTMQTNYSHADTIAQKAAGVYKEQ
jgi:hypothetical protein